MLQVNPAVWHSGQRTKHTEKITCRWSVRATREKSPRQSFPDRTEPSATAPGLASGLGITISLRARPHLSQDASMRSARSTIYVLCPFISAPRRRSRVLQLFTAWPRLTCRVYFWTSLLGVANAAVPDCTKLDTSLRPVIRLNTLLAPVIRLNTLLAPATRLNKLLAPVTRLNVSLQSVTRLNWNLPVTCLAVCRIVAVRVAGS